MADQAVSTKPKGPIPRPKVMRNFLRPGLYNAFGKGIFVGCSIAFGYYYFITRPRIRAYNEFYKNYDADKDAWDLVYDYWPCRKYRSMCLSERGRESTCSSEKY